MRHAALLRLQSNFTGTTLRGKLPPDQWKTPLRCGSVPGRAHQQPNSRHKHAQHDGQQDVGALAGPAHAASQFAMLSEP